MPTRRETAERIVKAYYPDDDELLDSILAALNAERERAAKIADAKYAEYSTEAGKTDRAHQSGVNLWAIRARTASTLADLIRGKD